MFGRRKDQLTAGTIDRWLVQMMKRGRKSILVAGEERSWITRPRVSSTGDKCWQEERPTDCWYYRPLASADDVGDGRIYWWRVKNVHGLLDQEFLQQEINVGRRKDQLTAGTIDHWIVPMMKRGRKNILVAGEERSWITRPRVSSTGDKCWQEERPTDCWYYRPLASADDEEGSEEQSFLLIYQSLWQKYLLDRYGSELVLLDAAYRTARYNVCYSVILPLRPDNFSLRRRRHYVDGERRLKFSFRCIDHAG